MFSLGPGVPSALSARAGAPVACIRAARVVACSGRLPEARAAQRVGSFQKAWLGVRVRFGVQATPAPAARFIGRIVAETPTSATALHPSPAAKQLLKDIESAVAAEDYSQAAQLQSELKELAKTDVGLRARFLREDMARAVAAEEYELAAQIRDELLSISEDALNEPKEGISDFPISNVSDVSTNGVRVRARSYLVPNRSSPDDNYFFFAYAINITNEGDETVQLLSRHWVIKDADGNIEHVRGPGVVGETPVLEPGKSFEYTSACPISLNRRLGNGEIAGCMKGTYQMVVIGSDEKFDADVGPFALL
eukprot:tig00021569_g22345.t1